MRASRLHIIRIRPAFRNGKASAVDPSADDAAAKGPVRGRLADVTAGEGVWEGVDVEEVGVGGGGGKVVGAGVEGAGCAGADGGGCGCGGVDGGVLGGGLGCFVLVVEAGGGVGKRVVQGRKVHGRGVGKKELGLPRCCSLQWW